jgi:Luciferase-like monooxygenase
VRDIIAIVRKLVRDALVSHRRDVITIERFDLWFRPHRPEIPIYVAALFPTMLETAAELADGALIRRGHWTLVHVDKTKVRWQPPAEHTDHSLMKAAVALSPMSMILRRAVLLLAVPPLLGAGCATIQRYNASETERLLTAAGFQMRGANTSESEQELRSMPPHRIVSGTKNGGVVYTYADPDNCRCVYVGGDKEYSEYGRLISVEREYARRLSGGSSPSGGSGGGAP